VSRFSDDGQWWWDGARWIPTAEIVLPVLPMTEFERSGLLAPADRNRTYLDLLTVLIIALGFSAIGLPLATLVVFPWFVLQSRVFRAYRLLTLQQLALATTYLLGPDEPMLAGEPSLFRRMFEIGAARDQAVVITKHHVLILLFRDFAGPPGRVALAARSGDVDIAGNKALIASKITVAIPGRSWTFKCESWVAEPAQLVAAWRQTRAQPAAPAGSRI
jgi:hypothetical protein